MEVYTTMGQQAMYSLIVNLFFIAVAFYALQSLRLDQLFKKGKTFQVQLTYILFSIVIGTTVSNFFLNFSTWSKQLQYLF